MKKIFFIFLLFAGCRKVDQFHAGQVNDSSPLPDKPNVIFILGDDVGYECLTVDGGGSYDTHNLDLLATQNTRYTECHGCPLCSPSRFELMTGKYNFRNYFQWGVMAQTNKTFGNVFRDAGYRTMVFGKWQLDGGGVSADAFGFDRYVLHDAFAGINSRSRYKNPYIYTHGAYLSTAQTAGKYGDDIFTDSLIGFISKQSDKPFFAYYPMALVHVPFQPTPDDAEFDAWNSVTDSDPKYFPSMIKYMDKLVGKILNAVDSLNLNNNTVVIFSGDNGTPGTIYSIFGDTLIKGGKGKTTEYGTHVPLIVKGFGSGVNQRLIDFSDFLPTLADIANVGMLNNYGILDGQSFLGDIKRDWIFCQFWKNPFNGDSSNITRWVQNDTYKLYDSLSSRVYKANGFFDFAQHPIEENWFKIKNPTPEQQVIKDNFINVLNMMH